MREKNDLHKQWFNLVASSCLVILLLSCGAALWAQTTTGTIVGRIMDPSGAVVVGVAVTVINEETGLRRSVSTNTQGDYTVNLLPIGRYSIEAELSGFKKAKVSGIVLQVNQTVRIDQTMQVGEVTQSVEVTSEIPLIETDRSDGGKLSEPNKWSSFL